MDFTKKLCDNISTLIGKSPCVIDWKNIPKSFAEGFFACAMRATTLGVSLVTGKDLSMHVQIDPSGGDDDQEVSARGCECSFSKMP